MNTKTETFGNCVVAVMGSRPSKEMLEQIEKDCRAAAQNHDGSVVLMGVLEEGQSMLNTQERRAVEMFYHNLSSHLRGVALVVEGTNLWAVSARSVMTALRLVQRRSYPLRTFADIDAAVEWVSDMAQLPEGVGLQRFGEHLCELVGSLRDE